MWIGTKCSKKHHFTPKSTQFLRDPCKILVHDIKVPFNYKCSIYAQVCTCGCTLWYKIHKNRKNKQSFKLQCNLQTHVMLPLQCNYIIHFCKIEMHHVPNGIG